MKFKKFKQEYEIVHLTVYPYGVSEISKEDTKHCLEVIKKNTKRY